MSQDFNNNHTDDYGEKIYSNVVRAGKRTYFFDVKATRGGDYFLAITESRKIVAQNGTTSYARNQVYLYKEDFNKYIDGLSDTINFIKQNKPEYFTQNTEADIDEEFEKL